MDLAAILSLRQPATIVVGDLTLVVPVRTAVEWLASTTEHRPLLELLDLEDARDVAVFLYDPESGIDDDVLDECWRQALSAQSGLPWYAAQRLLGALAHQWSEVAGELALRGMDTLRAPLDLVLAATLALIRRNTDEKEQRKVLAEIFDPPPSEKAAPEPPGWSAEEIGQAWLAAARSPATAVAAGARLEAPDALPS